MNAQPVSTPSTLVKKAVRKIRKSYLFNSHLRQPPPFGVRQNCNLHRRDTVHSPRGRK